MSAHTKEPWSLCEVENSSGRIKHLVPIDSKRLSLLTLVENDQATFAAIYNDADARRIIACVNACAGIDTDVLEVFGAATEQERSFVKAARRLKEQADRQRDEMLSALVAMVQEPQPLGIDRDSYQTALALVIKYHDNVDNPEDWAARKASA